MPTKTAFSASQLHVIAVISNPRRFASRIKLFKEFEQRMKDAGVTLWVCELAYGDRPFTVTEPSNPQHLQLRTFHELWHKENMMNLMAQRLPLDAEYIAFVDADISFKRADWAVETIQMLQHHYVVQMWREAYDLGPNGEVIESHQSFMYRYVNGLTTQAKVGDMYTAFGHPGFAWAWRREALDWVGGNLETAILGAADHHMCLALVGQVDRSIPGNIGQAYFDECHRWQARAERYLTRDVGYVETGVDHYWHGKKRDRRYIPRWDILIKNQFTPYLDLQKDTQGVLCLTDRSIDLRDDIRRYFLQRNEDSVDL